MPLKRGRKVLRWATPMTKEEKRREALEREQALKKERLLREIELGALNTQRYRRSWREIMMRAKMPVIKEEIETAWRRFDRILDNKDHSIEILMKSVDEAEEQVLRSRNSHSDVIDRLLNVYEMRTRAISTTYELKIGETLNETNVETSIFKRNSRESLSQLQYVIHVMEERLDSLLSNTKSKTMSKIDAFVSDKTNVRRLAVAKRERQLNDLSTDLRRTLTKYYRDTKNRQSIYDAAREKDEKEQQIITQQYVRIAILLEIILKIREKIASHQSIVNKNIKEIMDEQHFFHTSYCIMKNRLISEQKVDRVQLIVTTIEFKLTKTYLERLAKKVTSLLGLLLICHKYETLYEKICSYTDYKELDFAGMSTTYDWHGSTEVINNFQYLTNFWRRNAIVQMMIDKLKLEKEKLQTEVNVSRKMLKCYLSHENNIIREIV